MLFDQLYAVYKVFGRNALKGALTPSRALVERVCKRTGADVAKAMEERNEAVEEMLEFFEACTDKDFEDPEGEG